MQQHWFRSVKHMLNTDLMLWQGAASSLFMGSVLVKRADAQGIACVLLGIAALIAFDILLRFGIVSKALALPTCRSAYDPLAYARGHGGCANGAPDLLRGVLWSCLPTLAI